MELLVKLASLGTSGICIFAIFKIGNVLQSAEAELSSSKISLIKNYMLACVVIAIISLVAVVFESYHSRIQLAKSLAIVLESKSAHELRNPDPAIRNHIIALSDFLNEAGVKTGFYVERQQP